MACLLTATMLMPLMSGCGSREPRPSAETLVFWERFLATNSAWLDPSPPALSCEFTLQRKEHDPDTKTFPWRDAGALSIWCTPEKNLRIVHQEPLGTDAWRTNEYRYFHGRGGRVELKPGGKLRDLTLDMWMSGRTGAGWLSYLHLCAAWGLPPPAELRAGPGNTIVLAITNIPALPATWRREMILTPAYGLHPAVFGSQSAVSPQAMEAIVDRDSLLPEKIRELNEQGNVVAEVIFSQPWLSLNGRKVPGRVQCRLPATGFDLTCEFTVEQGAWILRELTRETEAYSLCSKARLRALNAAPIPDERFPSPHDLEVPDRSFTTLAPGERIVRVPTAEGLSLEAKLSLPPAVTEPAPVVFFLPGAGPFTFDRPLVYPDFTKLNEPFPPVKRYNYFDFFARELSARGWGLFRMNKRGCGIVADNQGHPREICNRTIFARATPSVLLEDYRRALTALRQQPGVDPNRIVLLGASEGTRMATRLAAKAPEGVRAVVMFGYAGDSTRNTIVWQNTVGPWRNVAKLFDENGDGRILRAEYDEVVRVRGRMVADALPFNQLDRNRNGVVTPEEMGSRRRADEILEAVRQRNDDYLWENLLQLSSAYLLEDWEGAPLHQELLKLQMPLAIFHGENDGACRVEAVREAQQAFQAAGRTNLEARIYPKTDHDLNWARFLRDGKTPEAFSDIFELITELGK